MSATCSCKRPSKEEEVNEVTNTKDKIESEEPKFFIKCSTIEKELEQILSSNKDLDSCSEENENAGGNQDYSHDLKCETITTQDNEGYLE